MFHITQLLGRYVIFNKYGCVGDGFNQSPKVGTSIPTPKLLRCFTDVRWCHGCYDVPACWSQIPKRMKGLHREIPQDLLSQKINEISALQFQIAPQMYHISSMSISQGVQENKVQLRQKTSTFVKGSFFWWSEKTIAGSTSTLVIPGGTLQISHGNLTPWASPPGWYIFPMPWTLVHGKATHLQLLPVLSTNKTDKTPSIECKIPLK